VLLEAPFGTEITVYWKGSPSSMGSAPAFVRRPPLGSLVNRGNYPLVLYERKFPLHLPTDRSIVSTPLRSITLALSHAILSLQANQRGW
jgi:hypothetical protein